jgi:nitroreductase
MDPDRPVDPSTIADLVRLATWAPNHHKTEPWRFAVFTGEGRRELGDTIATAQAATDAPAAKVAKTRVKYLRAPAMVVVGSKQDEDPKTALEDRDAVAAAVQTLLLAATGRGLASFWSSVATPTAPALLRLCGFDPDVACVAAIYLGHPTGTCPPPGRSDPKVRWIG